MNGVNAEIFGYDEEKSHLCSGNAEAPLQIYAKRSEIFCRPQNYAYICNVGSNSDMTY